MKTNTTVTGELSAKEVEDAIIEFLDNYLEHTVPHDDYSVAIHADGSASFTFAIKKDKA